MTENVRKTETTTINTERGYRARDKSEMYFFDFFR
jgi:hypothetical protein